MESVARESEVTKPVVYSAFANSADLLQALVAREQVRAMTQLQQAVPGDINLGDPIESASVGISSFLSAVRSNPATWQLLLSADQLPEAARAQRDRARDLLVTQITALTEVGLAGRRSGPLDPELVARLIVVSAESLARLVLDDPDVYTEERTVAFVAELVRSVQEG